MKRRTLLLVLFLSACPFFCYAQKKGQLRLDSLLQELPKATEDTNMVNLLNAISYVYPYINPDEGLKRGLEALALAQKLSWTLGIADAYAAIGGNYANKADYANALDHEYKALKIYEQLDERYKQANLLRNIAIVHRASKNPPKALEYNYKALKIYESLQNKDGIAATYSNLANVYYTLKDKEKVVENHMKALGMYEELKDRAGTARVLGNLANFYAEEGEFSKAMVYYFDALRKETALGNKNGVTRNMGNIGETYLDIYRAGQTVEPDSLIPAGRTANLHKSIQYLRTTIRNARELRQTEFILAYGEVLSEAYRLAGRYEEALATYQNYVVLRDSVFDVEKYNAATRRELEYEFGKREDSIAYQKRLTDVKLVEEAKSRSREKSFYTIGIGLVLLFSGFMFNRWRITRQQKQLIEQEKRRSDTLLLNILPAETAEELKATGIVRAKDFEQVSVMFTDFKNFTVIGETLSAQELVNEINFCYSAFDRIVGKHGLEKIKTIGDSYMCAGGLPVPNATHAADIVHAAMEIRDFMRQEKRKRSAEEKTFFEMRIGIHTGPIVAGVVGTTKFAYDIWGDTVNIAARMETSGEVDKINISGATYALVKDRFSCTYRGKIQAKNKGEIDMYFVD